MSWNGPLSERFGHETERGGQYVFPTMRNRAEGRLHFVTSFSPSFFPFTGENRNNFEKRKSFVMLSDALRTKMLHNNPLKNKDKIKTSLYNNVKINENK